MAFETLEAVENIQLQLIEQKKLVNELKTENDRLKTENEKVKARLEKIEALIGFNAEN
jgi:regulator of replication initiation timing